MKVETLAKMLNESAEDPRNGFYTYGLARETLGVWQSPTARALLSEYALTTVEIAESANA